MTSARTTGHLTPEDYDNKMSLDPDLTRLTRITPKQSPNVSQTTKLQRSQRRSFTWVGHGSDFYRNIISAMIQEGNI